MERGVIGTASAKSLNLLLSPREPTKKIGGIKFTFAKRKNEPIELKNVGKWRGGAWIFYPFTSKSIIGPANIFGKRTVENTLFCKLNS
jgi:hypothetical protein